MKLFMICHDDEDGDGHNFNLLVRCDTAEQAVDYWRAYFLMTGGELPNQMFEVNLATIGPLPWHHGNGLKVVTTRYHTIAEAANALGLEVVKP
jgi:hypothetical protein